MYVHIYMYVYILYTIKYRSREVKSHQENLMHFLKLQQIWTVMLS